MLIGSYTFPSEIHGPIPEGHLSFPLLLTVVAIIVVLGMALTCGSLSIGKRHLSCISSNLISTFLSSLYDGCTGRPGPNRRAMG